MSKDLILISGITNQRHGFMKQEFFGLLRDVSGFYRACAGCVLACLSSNFAVDENRKTLYTCFAMVTYWLSLTKP